MRSRLAARSARLVLAAVAVTALAATTTACNADDVADAGSSSAAAPAGSESPATNGSGSSDSGSSGTSTEAPKSGGSTAKPDSADGDKSGSGSGSGEKSGYGQTCGTNDLDFTISSESQAGGYYLVTAKAKSGITCYLDTNTPSVSFGSGADGVASPVGQGGEEPIKLGGSTAAYAGISPNTTNSDNGKQFDNVIIATTNDDADPAELKLPSTAAVDKPIVTNWATNSSEAVPAIA